MIHILERGYFIEVSGEGRIIHRWETILKHLYPEAVDMVVETEWYISTKRMITQEENSTNT